MTNYLKVKYILIIMFVFANICNSAAQDVPFEKQYFKNRVDDYRKAVNNIYDGDYQFEKENYELALELYLHAYNLNTNSSELNYKIGLCHLYSLSRYKCLQYFTKAFELNRDVDMDIHFMMGRGFQLNNNFKLAHNEYVAHLNAKEKEIDQEEIKIVKRYMKECENGMRISQKYARAFVDNLGSDINSKYLDHSPLISADESLLIFTSTRENGKKIGLDNQYDEDIYLTTRVNKKWEKPFSIGEPVNTQFNDATVGLSPDGQKLIIYNGNRGNGDLQTCWLSGDAWNYPKNLPNQINSDYRETAACFSPDGNVLYFISDRDGGYGGSDIWYSRKDKKERWGEVKNLGGEINSEYNEETVFMHPDGRTLYFSSEGHESTGGYDIFVSTLDDNGNWSKPKNMGYPVNSPDDDLCFVISANGRHGYCSSVRPDSYGGFDIYRMTFLGPEKPLVFSNEDNLIAVRSHPVSEMAIEESVEIKTIRLTIVKGFVKDAITNEPVAAQIDIVDNEKNEVIFTSNTNSSSGKFLVSLPSGKNYGLIVKADEYLFHSENFNIPGATEYQEISKDILLNNLKKDVKIVLRNVFFETASAKLRPASYAELGRLSKLLEENPDLKIEISGHTDNQGSHSSNQKLSEARAKSVVDFLIALGISADRLEYKGYAFDQPVADNSTQEGRALNRRVEFKVLSN
ncbi:MAG: PD40 domain-containing protein [Salinivirgaceae bacterium]|nr:PD40 domain-containing protein [Salinivirgaceae bacterium]